jgi:hypothetical protein
MELKDDEIFGIVIGRTEERVVGHYHSNITTSNEISLDASFLLIQQTSQSREKNINWVYQATIDQRLGNLLWT